MTTDDELQNLALVYHRKNTLCFCDFINNNASQGNNAFLGGGFYSNVNGTGATCASSASIFSYQTGVIAPTTGSTATGRAGYFVATNTIVLNEMRITFQADIRINAGLATTAENYNIKTGFLKNITTAANTNLTDGIYFQYRGDGNPNWEAVCVNNNTATVVDTGIAAENLGNPRYFEIRAQKGTGLTEQAEFYIDGTLVATITTNLPGTAIARSFGAGSYIVKSAGTGGRSFQSDYANVFVERTEQGLRP